MRILVIGAGVTGSLFACFLINGKAKIERTFKEKVEIKLLARGERFKDIDAHGLRINHVVQKITTIDRIPAISRLESGDRYDYVLVFLRKSQIASLLPDLASNKSDYFLFAGNNGTGTDHLKSTLSPDRIALGFALTGGKREGNTVHSIHADRPSIIIGSAAADRKKRLIRLTRVLRAAGISPRRYKSMDNWLKYHMALVSPLAALLCRKVEITRELLIECVIDIKKGIRSLESLGYPAKPFRLRLLPLLPDPFIRQGLRRYISSGRKGQLLIEQCKAEPEEMQMIAEEFKQIVDKVASQSF